MVNQYNEVLSKRISKELQDAQNTLRNLTSEYPEIENVKQKILEYDVIQFEHEIVELLEKKLIEEWLRYQAMENVEQYDMINFEYNHESFESADALSYGVFDMKNYKLTIDSHNFGYEYKFASWEAGLGIVLEPFKLTEPIDYRSFDNEEYRDLIIGEDATSGYDEIWKAIHAICRYSLNCAFRRTDDLKRFEKLRIREGGLFTYNEHDNGGFNPTFYLKE